MVLLFCKFYSVDEPSIVDYCYVFVTFFLLSSIISESLYQVSTIKSIKNSLHIYLNTIYIITKLKTVVIKYKLFSDDNYIFITKIAF